MRVYIYISKNVLSDLGQRAALSAATLDVSFTQETNIGLIQNEWTALLLNLPNIPTLPVCVLLIHK